MKKIIKSGVFVLLVILFVLVLVQLSDVDCEVWMQVQQCKVVQVMCVVLGFVSFGVVVNVFEFVGDQDKMCWMFDFGKFIVIGGVIQVEGVGGGGLMFWVLIIGYGMCDSYGVNVYYIYLVIQDYMFKFYGVVVGMLDWLELLLVKQEFYGSLVLLVDFKIMQDIVGIKFKLVGDVVYDQDCWLLQIVVGVMFKYNNGIGGLGMVISVKQFGVVSDVGIDYYFLVIKLLLEQSLLFNGMLWLIKVNQMGLFGFGGDFNDCYQVMGEFLVVYLINWKLVLGVEYCMKLCNLVVDYEKDYYDVFLVWFFSKNLLMILVYVVLGDIIVYNFKW